MMNMARQNYERFLEMARDIKKYEEAQYIKAFMEGTDEAWKRYRTNLKRKINKIYKETGFRIDFDRLVSM